MGEPKQYRKPRLDEPANPPDYENHLLTIEKRRRGEGAAGEGSMK
jgi:hypothetical protein